jgi:TPR repeat protein
MASCTWTRSSALLAFLLLTILGGCSYKTGQLSYDRGDSQRAAEIWRRLAEWGDPAASLALGRLYLRGEGVPRDLAEAERLIRPVAKAADASMRGWALYHLGEIALEQKRPAQAADDFRQAAALENGWAKAALARLYLEGEGVARNPGRAASLYQ